MILLIGGSTHTGKTPVSYTHLDVYKRQVKINAGDDEYREHLDPDRWRFALQQMWSHRVNLRTD